MIYARKILFLNGPPKSGKDALARELTRRDMVNNWRGMKLAANLKVATHILHGLTHHGSDYFEESKDTPNDLFFGKTPRQAYIEVSEQMVKPVKGQDFFGRVAAAQIHRGDTGMDVVVTDCGFYHELLPSIVNDVGDIYPFAYLVRIGRAGKDYSNDSRSYLTGRDIDRLFGPRQLDFTNDGDTPADLLESGKAFTKAVQKLTYSEDPDAETIRAVTRWYENASFRDTTTIEGRTQLSLPVS